MHTACMCVRVFVVLGITLALAFVPSSSTHAQAWLPPQGEGTFTLGYQYSDVGGHLLASDVLDGLPIGNGHNVEGNSMWLGDITGQNIFLAVDYGLFEHLAGSADMVFVQSKVEGGVENPEIDNGNYHGGFQDLRLGLRYMALRAPVVLTPFLSYSFPTRDYPVIGHSAIGRGLSEFQIGLAAGHTLDMILPGLYVDARYARAFVEDYEGLNLDRNEVGLNLGFFATPEFSINTFGQYRKTDGGLDWLDDVILADPGDVAHIFHAHDAGAALMEWRLGGGVSWAATDLVALSLSVSTTVSGENTHESTGFSLSSNWDIGSMFHRPPRMIE